MTGSENLMSDAIQANQLVKSFGDVRAVDGLTMNLGSGEIYGLIGPDGAGKTTSLRIFMGGILPDSGEILVDGMNALKHPDHVREVIGYMPQAYGLYGDLTVYENLDFFGRLQGIKSAHRKDRIEKLLSFVRLNHFKNRRTDALSGGMYKKLAIACSIIHEPRILILDEPTNGVDPVSRRELWALLFELSSEGVSILVSTPYMDEAERCDRVGLMFHGRVEREGTPEELIKKYGRAGDQKSSASVFNFEDIFLDLQRQLEQAPDGSGTEDK